MATKNAGAGRGFLNPQRTDEKDEDYVSLVNTLKLIKNAESV